MILKNVFFYTRNWKGSFFLRNHLSSIAMLTKMDNDVFLGRLRMFSPRKCKVVKKWTLHNVPCPWVLGISKTSVLWTYWSTSDLVETWRFCCTLRQNRDIEKLICIFRMKWLWNGRLCEIEYSTPGNAHKGFRWNLWWNRSQFSKDLCTSQSKLKKTQDRKARLQLRSFKSSQFTAPFSVSNHKRKATFIRGIGMVKEKAKPFSSHQILQLVSFNVGPRAETTVSTSPFVKSLYRNQNRNMTRLNFGWK